MCELHGELSRPCTCVVCHMSRMPSPGAPLKVARNMLGSDSCGLWLAGNVDSTDDYFTTRVGRRGTRTAHLDVSVT